MLNQKLGHWVESEKACVNSRGHSFDPKFMKRYENVNSHNILVRIIAQNVNSHKILVRIIAG